MLNFPFILLIFFGILFIFLFITVVLSIQGKLTHHEKIMKFFRTKLFDDPIKINPKTSILFMIVLFFGSLILEFFIK